MKRLLLDTHVFLWWRQDNATLSAEARAAIRDADVVHVSLVSAWEVAVMSAMGRLRLARPFAAGIAASHFEPLPIRFEHIDDLERLPHLHRDPFDRMLVAQARVEGLTLVSRDTTVLAYDVQGLLA